MDSVGRSTAGFDRLDWRWLSAVSIIAAIIAFYRLGDPPIFWWDEARVAINSLEMLRHPGLIVTFHNQPDLWNTKPPLAIWLNALSMALFGTNEWALRLPTALAAIGTTVAVFVFTRRISDRQTALLASLILWGIGGFVEVHVARTADFDALLVLFTTLTTFSLFAAFESKDFRLPAAFFALGLLTKGIAGGMMAPGCVLYAAIYRKDLRRAILPGLAATLVVGAYYLTREWVGPGYLRAVWQSDIVRYAVPAEGNAGTRLGYLANLFWPWGAFPWSFVALAAPYKPSRPAIYLLCCICTYLLIVSTAATRLFWYVAPVYPLIAVLAALAARRVQRPVIFFAVAVLYIGLNIWKIEEVIRQPRETTVYLTPDGQPYRGPAEFYSAR